MKKELGIAILLIVLCVALTILQPTFVGAFNVSNMLKRISMYGIFSIGEGLVIITGGIDLSVGSVLGLQGVILCMMLTETHLPWSVAVLISLVGPMVLGAIQGLLVTKVRLQPFIVTLCGLMIYRGLARSITRDDTKGLTGSDIGAPASYGWLEKLTNGSVHTGIYDHPHFGSPTEYTIPNAFVLLLVVSAIMIVILHWSIYGRYLFAVGRNEEAARYSGINTRLVIGSAYVLCLLLTAISGLLFVFDIRSVSPNDFGSTYELYGIAAAVLGGCSLLGGEGSILGIILGTALLRVLQNLVGLFRIQGNPIPNTWEPVVMGVVILIGVMFDQFLKSRKKKTPAVVPVSQAPSPPTA